jgi:hypothetical protein
MDALLAKLGVQAVNYAIRSGIALTSTFAIQQCARLMKTVDDKGIYLDLKALQKLLDSKIKVGRGVGSWLVGLLTFEFLDHLSYDRLDRV